MNHIKLIAIIFSFTTVFSSLYGLGYQKGLILEMGLGNLAGNYEINEIINSAISGYIHIFAKIARLSPLDIFLKNQIVILFFSIGISLTAFFIHLIFASPKKKKIFL